ncbi:hypothetical protein EBU94_07125 [bacterium]|nr:hypothetical protein [bacterium]
MKTKDQIYLEKIYSNVKPTRLIKEENELGDKQYIAEIENVNVYNVDKDSFDLGVQSGKVTLLYEIEFDFRRWGIKDFNVFPKKLMPFSIDIEDDYNVEDFEGPKTLVDFSQGLDVSQWKVGDVELKAGYSLHPSSVDIWIKMVNGKWEIVPENCEISF